MLQSELCLTYDFTGDSFNESQKQSLSKNLKCFFKNLNGKLMPLLIAKYHRANFGVDNVLLNVSFVDSTKSPDNSNM